MADSATTEQTRQLVTDFLAARTAGDTDRMAAAGDRRRGVAAAAEHGHRPVRRP